MAGTWPRAVLATLLLLLGGTSAKLGRGAARRREEQGGQWSASLLGGAAGWQFASKRMHRTFTPGSVAFRPIRSALPANQKAAVALAGAATGLALARAACETGDLPATLVQRLGQAGLKVTDGTIGIVDNVRSRMRRAKAEAEKRERQEWLRAHTKPSRVMVR